MKRAKELVVGDIILLKGIVRNDEIPYIKIDKIEITPKGRVRVFWDARPYVRGAHTLQNDQKLITISESEFAELTLRHRENQEKEREIRRLNNMRRYSITVGEMRQLIKNRDDGDILISSVQNDEDDNGMIPKGTISVIAPSDL